MIQSIANNIIAMSIFFLGFNSYVIAKEALIIPRFASIKSDEVNARTGPNVKYPISWIYIKKGEPIEIIAEFEQWKKVRDYKKDEAWIHESMISNKRFVIIKNSKNQTTYKNPNKLKRSFIAESGLRALLTKCRDEFCEIKAQNHNGWIEKSKLWGVYEKEDYN